MSTSQHRLLFSPTQRCTRARGTLRPLVLFSALVPALFLAFGLLWITTPAVQAATCSVPSGSYPSIQSAVNDNACDAASVAAGVYTGTVTITRTFIITGAGPSQTILDGEDSNRPLTVSGSGVEVRVRDLAVRNGDASGSSPQVAGSGRSGGGIMLYEQAKLWLDNVYVYDNVAKSIPTVTGFGGGIGVWGQSQLHATNVRVYDNVANNSGGSGFGGGIAVLYATAYITNSEVLTNAAKVNNISAQARGGGLYVAQDAILGGTQSSYLSIVNSTIAGNYATNSNQVGYGGGLYVGEANTIRVWSRGNTWRDNVARKVTSGDDDGQGGAIAADLTASGLDVRLYLDGDTFYRNVANPANDLSTGSRADAGALFLDANEYGNLHTVISNTTFYSNTAQSSSSGNDRGDGGAIRARHIDLTIHNSEFFSNTARATGTSRGGAIRLESTAFSMTQSILHDNTASLGSAIFSTNGASTPGRLDLTNVLIANENGTSGIYQDHDNPALLDIYRHVTLVGTSSGVGLLMVGGQAAVTNTIVTSYSVGISNTGGTFSGSHVLFFGNTTDQANAAPTNTFNADPQFVGTTALKYHISSTSPARENGVDIGVLTDIDGQLRDATPDIGADEYSTADVPIAGLSIQGPNVRSVGSTANFTATVSSGTGISYTWDFGNESSGSSGNPVSYAYPSTGTYTVSVVASNSEGTVTATKPIQIVEQTITGLSIDGPSTRPVGSQATFTATVSSGTSISYTWDFGNGSSGSSGNPVSYAYPNTGTYTVSVVASNSKGTVTATKPIEIVDQAITNLSIDGPSTRPVGSQATFTATVSSGTGISYTWGFGNGASGSGNPISYTYSTTGTYTVAVTATNSVGTAVATKSIVITSSSSGSDTPIDGLTAQNSSPTLVNATTYFTAAVTSGSNISYTWSFGDGASGSGMTTTHSYTGGGVYTATVTAVNDANTRVATTTVYIGDAIVEVGPNFTNSFSPAEVTIGPGDTVIWVLRSGFHSVTANNGSFEQPAGSDWSPYVHTFSTEGTYPYFCTVHPGMTGTVVVTGSGPGPSITPRAFAPFMDK